MHTFNVHITITFETTMHLSFWSVSVVVAFRFNYHMPVLTISVVSLKIRNANDLIIKYFVLFGGKCNGNNGTFLLPNY